MNRPPIPKTVKPRKTNYVHRPIIAVHKQEVWLELTGEVVPTSRLPELVRTEPSSLIVAHDSGRIVRRLSEIYGRNPRWQFRATPMPREIRKLNGETGATIAQVAINYFGFTDPSSARKHRYHYPLDPSIFMGATVRQLRPQQHTTLTALIAWGKDVRRWCEENDIPIRPTTGGIAAILLRDKRFYPKPRRKVPRATNARVREYLPGNYYRLYCPTREPFSATYLDQKAAHHSCARDLILPNADSLFAKGRFHADKPGKFWARRGTALFARTLDTYGLLHVAVNNPVQVRGKFPLPVQERHGFQRVFVWTNELDYLWETGTEIVGIYSAWTSHHADDGLNAYAKWALQQIDANPDSRPWLKPTLLATYGVLAAKPRRREFGYHRSAGGEPRIYPVGGELLPVQALRTTGKIESPIANVIHRGMIEAETRLRSIRMARWLTETYGFRVLAIYADGVFIENTGRTMPFLPDGWEVEAHLSRLRFFNPTSFDSRELQKLPGIPTEDRKRLEHVRAFRTAIRRDGRDRRDGKSKASM